MGNKVVSIRTQKTQKAWNGYTYQVFSISVYEEVQRKHDGKLVWRHVQDVVSADGFPLVHSCLTKRFENMAIAVATLMGVRYLPGIKQGHTVEVVHQAIQPL